MVGYFSAHIQLGKAIAVFAVSAYLLMSFSVLLLPERRGMELTE
jgi:hypothetical protein